MDDVGTYRVSDDDLATMVKLLEAFGGRNKLPTDGRGIFLGDGIPRAGLSELRSNDLLSLLKEAAAARRLKQIGWEQRYVDEQGVSPWKPCCQATVDYLKNVQGGGYKRYELRKVYA